MKKKKDNLCIASTKRFEASHCISLNRFNQCGKPLICTNIIDPHHKLIHSQYDFDQIHNFPQ